MTTQHSRDGELCPACGEGHLSSHVEFESVEYNGRHKELPLHFSLCDHCGSELAGSAESKQNARAMTAFKKEVHGLLSGAEIKLLREKYSLTQDVCARIFGGGAVAFSRYEHDDIMQSPQMDKLLRLCHDDPKNIARLAKQSGVQLQPDTLNQINEDSRLSIDEMLKSALFAFRQYESAKPELRLPTESLVPANDAQYERFSSSPRPARGHSKWVMECSGAAA